MRKHFFASFLVLVGCALFAPASWLSSLHAQTITPITIPASGTFTAAQALSKASYRGNAAASNLGTPSRGGGSWNHHEQDWFAVSLVAGLTYTFTETMLGDPNDNAVLSLQNSSGVQVAFCRSTQPTGTITYKPTASGTYTLICSRNDNLTVTSPFTLTISVPETATTTSISAPAINYPNNGVVIVTVSDASATPIGNVTLQVDGGPALTQALSGGSATFVLPGLAVGVHSLSASYAAQPGFAASSGTGTLAVYPTATTTTISAPAVTYPRNAAVTVTVNDPSATPAGTVTLSVDNGPGIVKTLASGAATFNLVGLAIGVHNLSASYSPQPGFTPSSSTSTVVVNPPTNLTIPVNQPGSLSASSYEGNAANTSDSGGQDPWSPAVSYQDWYTVTLIAGETYTISIHTTGDSFLSIQNASGTQVAWNDDAGLSSLGSPLASQIVFTPTATGVYTIICSTGALSAGTPLSYTLTIPLPVVPVSTTTTINTTGTVTQNASVPITVSAASGTPTGSVTLSVDGGAGITQQLSAGSTTFQLTGLSFGVHTLTASYSGGVGFYPSSTSGALFVGIPNARLAPAARPSEPPIMVAERCTVSSPRKERPWLPAASNSSLSQG